MSISFLTLFVFWVKVTLDINPIYGQMDRPCPNNFKNIFQSYVDQTDRNNKQKEKKTYQRQNKINDIF